MLVAIVAVVPTKSRTASAPRPSRLLQELGRDVLEAAVDALVGAELEGPRAFVGGDVGDDDARLRQDLQVLDREAPEPAGADHERGAAGAQAIGHALHAVERRRAGVGQRAGAAGVEAFEGEDRARALDDHVVGDAAVHAVAAAELVPVTGVVESRIALEAMAARARRDDGDGLTGLEAADAATERVDPAADFVAEGEGHLPAEELLQRRLEAGACGDRSGRRRCPRP